MNERELFELLSHALEAEREGALGVRRELRQCPELAGCEHRTAETVERALGETVRVVDTGVVARVGTAEDAVVVRAELDAIEADGRVLHACGHDAHMAALVALVRAGRQVESELPSQLVAAFQPSEEAYPSGAARMVDADVLGGGVRALIAAHAHPDVAWGEVSCDAGVVNAAADLLEVTMVGSPGHVAYPDWARNPISPLASFVTAVESAATEGGLPPDTLAAVSSITAGGAGNVTPATARATLALRALNLDARVRLRRQIDDAAAAAARAHGCELTLELTQGEPPLINDPALSERAARLLERSGLTRAPRRSSFGSDDFAHFGSLGPLLMMFVGLDGAPEFQKVGLHHPRFAVPDEAVGAIALAMAAGYCAAAASAA